MNMVVFAIINGFVASTLTTALVYILLRLLPRNALNAATRYWIWWVTMAIALILPLFFIHLPVNRPSPSIPGSTAPVLVAEPHTSPSHFEARPPVVAAKASARRVRMPAFPIEMPAPRWPISILAIWSVVALLLIIRLLVSFFLLYRIRTRAFDVSGILAERIQQWIRDSSAQYVPSL